MNIYRFVTAATDIDIMDMLRLLISCLTGIGALALGTAVVVVLYVVAVMRRDKKPKRTEPLSVDWEAVLEDVQK